MNAKPGVNSSAREPDQVSDPRAPARFMGVAIWCVKWITISAIAAALIYFYSEGQLTREHLQQLAAVLPTPLFLAGYIVLPLFGFPISVALLASGFKFGFGIAIVIAFVGMAFHTLAAWHITQGIFQRRMDNWLRSSRYELPTIPDQHQIWLTSLFVTVPSLPYAIKLYSLALTNLPFRRYFPIVWLLHVVNAIPFIGMGTAATHIEPIWLVAFASLPLAAMLLSPLLKKWLFSSAARTGC